MAHPHALLAAAGLRGEPIQAIVQKAIHQKRYKKGVIVTTAHPKREEAHWAKVTKEQLEAFGLAMSFVDLEKGEGIGDADVVYVTGGNTFTLLFWAKKMHMYEQLLELFERGGMYIGSSAGAVIFSPNITSAGEIHPDKNDIGLADLQGFDFVPFHIVPHYTKEMEEDIAAFLEKHPSATIERLQNGEGIYLHNGTTKKNI